jgi:hypothetical protein
MQQVEIYKVIKGFENYSVSNLGNVKNNKTERILKSSDEGHGYLKLTLIKNKVRKTVKVHKLVANAFLLNPEHKVCIDHINGVRTDNKMNNLRFASHSQNSQNKSISSNNISGTTGVSFHRSTNKWCAKIGLNNKQIHIGLYETKDEAIQARIYKANQLYGVFVHHTQKIRNEIDLLEADLLAVINN